MRPHIEYFLLEIGRILRLKLIVAKRESFRRVTIKTATVLNVPNAKKWLAQSGSYTTVDMLEANVAKSICLSPAMTKSTTARKDQHMVQHMTGRETI